MESTNKSILNNKLEQQEGGAMSTLTVVSILGGDAVLKQHPHSEQEWNALIQRGIPAAAIEPLMHKSELTPAELSASLGLPEDLVTHPAKDAVLTPEESARLVRLARLLWRAADVFGDLHKGALWVRHPNVALWDVTPLSLIVTEQDLNDALDILGRIEYGVYS